MDIASESRPSDNEDYHPWPHLKTFFGPVVKKEAKENSNTTKLALNLLTVAETLKQV